MGFDPISWALIASTALSAGASVFGGIQQRKESKKQAMLAEEQANIRALEEEKTANTAARIQKMAFIKSGVLAGYGSPLTVMSETYEKGRENAENTRKTGRSTADLYRSQGDAAFTSGVIGGFKSVGQSLITGYDLGILNKKAEQ